MVYQNSFFYPFENSTDGRDRHGYNSAHDASPRMTIHTFGESGGWQRDLLAKSTKAGCEIDALPAISPWQPLIRASSGRTIIVPAVVTTSVAHRPSTCALR